MEMCEILAVLEEHYYKEKQNEMLLIELWVKLIDWKEKIKNISSQQIDNFYNLKLHI